MAKQSGLHQIRGKVGEHSYYRQTGVSAGLIRSINQGMSARVKNGPEYANTRLNNREFGAACDTAGILGKLVVPKFRPMILPFSQSRMAKAILDVAREHVQNWGERVVTSADTDRLCDILTAQSKRSADDFVNIVASRDSVNVCTLNATYSANQASLMLDAGANFLTVTVAAFNVATGQWIPQGQMMSTGYFEEMDRTPIIDLDEINDTGSESSEDLAVDQFVPASGHAGHQILVIVVMPSRMTSGINHVLQEYCSFKAIPMPPVSA